MNQTHKLPHKIILLRAPFHFRRPAEKGQKSFAKAFHTLFNEVYNDRMSLEESPEDPTELTAVVRRFPIRNQRAALFIWSRSDSLLRIEASLHIMRYDLRACSDIFNGYAEALVICFVESEKWSDVKGGSRAKALSKQMCLIDPPKRGVQPTLWPILAVCISLEYAEEDKIIFRRFLQRELHDSAKRSREGDTTLEYRVEDMIDPELLKSFKGE